MAILSRFLPKKTGNATITVLLKSKADLTILNAGGTAMSDAAEPGLFKADVAPVIAEPHYAIISDSVGDFFVGEIDAGETEIRGFERDRTKPTAVDIDTLLSANHGNGSWLSGAGGGSGPGPHAVNVTVSDGTNNLEGAIVRLVADVANDFSVTSVVTTGIAAFSIPELTYRALIHKPGYSFDPEDLIVAGDLDTTLTVTENVLAGSSEIGRARGYITINQNNALAGSGIPVSVRLKKGPGTIGVGQLNPVWTETTNSSSVAVFDGLVHGATYEIWVGSEGDNIQNIGAFVCPAESSVLLNEIIGTVVAG